MELHKIPGHPKYFITEDGQVWSEARGVRQLKPRIQTIGNYRRYMVTLGRGNHRKVGALVCLTFHGPRPSGHEVAHLNGDSLDNRASNLAWKTRQENELDKIDHGTSNRGARQWQAKLTDNAVRKIRSMAADGATQKVIAAEFGISQPTVSEIVNRRKWAWLD